MVMDNKTKVIENILTGVLGTEDAHLTSKWDGTYNTDGCRGEGFSFYHSDEDNKGCVYFGEDICINTEDITSVSVDFYDGFKTLDIHSSIDDATFYVYIYDNDGEHS